jgi:hypothetical protein
MVRQREMSTTRQAEVNVRLIDAALAGAGIDTVRIPPHGAVVTCGC